ncbi:3-hydroxy-3-methylglutaryl-coenzyme A (HMG-CoA) reductase isozyme [Podila clonocystis]|nr:3-hydroxy-3-methylglutaryl-coenzyme A (HMG-CoA) reductase isozyme [Podila clonocystis]
MLDLMLSIYISLALASSLLLNIFLLNIVKQSRQRPGGDAPQLAASTASSLSSSTISTIFATTIKISTSTVARQASTFVKIQPTRVLQMESLPEDKAMAEPTLANQGDRDPVQPAVDCLALVNSAAGAVTVTDEELVMLVNSSKISLYMLENTLDDPTRAVKICRALISRATHTKTLETSLLPMYHYDYMKVMGQCCENVIGYMPLPVGVAGPLNVDGQMLYLPMATTEGCLVASTSHGCKAINSGGGATTVLLADGMTRSPCVEFPSIVDAGACKRWIEGDGFEIMQVAFNSTSSFGHLHKLKVVVAGRLVYIRFSATTGDAMGMNMISKGCEKALKAMGKKFPLMSIVSLSGNYCMDKKPAAINWIEGRGKSVVTEAVIPGMVVETVLKTTVSILVDLNWTRI